MKLLGKLLVLASACGIVATSLATAFGGGQVAPRPGSDPWADTIKPDADGVYRQWRKEVAPKHDSRKPGSFRENNPPLPRVEMGPPSRQVRSITRPRLYIPLHERRAKKTPPAVTSPPRIETKPLVKSKPAEEPRSEPSGHAARHTRRRAWGISAEDRSRPV